MDDTARLERHRRLWKSDHAHLWHPFTQMQGWLEEEPLIVKLSDDEARIDGRADIDDLSELFDIQLNLEDEDEYDTVGGFIYHRIGGVPKPGDQVKVNDLVLTVETTDGRRVGKVLVVRTRDEDDPGDDEADR